MLLLCACMERDRQTETKRERDIKTERETETDRDGERGREGERICVCRSTCIEVRGRFSGAALSFHCGFWGSNSGCHSKHSKSCTASSSTYGAILLALNMVFNVDQWQNHKYIRVLIDSTLIKASHISYL